MSIRCCKCGGTKVTCEALINPNTKEFDHYTDESFLYGWCDDCKEGTVLTDVDEVKRTIDTQYREFIEANDEYISKQLEKDIDQSSSPVRVTAPKDCSSLPGFERIYSSGKASTTL